MPVKVHLALAPALRDIGVETMSGLVGDPDHAVQAIASRDWPRPLLIDVKRDPDRMPFHR